MNTNLRAFLMILIFAGSIVCKVWIYSQSQINAGSPLQITYLDKDSQKSDSDRPSHCAWNRLFKSKRRLEKFGFIQKASCPPHIENFYLVEKLFGLQAVHKPSVVALNTILQPPRPLSIS